MARSIYATPNGILAAARECGVTRSRLRQETSNRALALFERLLELFTKNAAKNRKANWFWDDFREPNLSVHRRADEDALLALGSAATPVRLLVEDSGRRKRGPAFWVFEATLDAAARTLDNHHLLEFYLVSRHLDWLIAENHHDVLIGVGDRAVAALHRFAQ